MWEPPSEHHAPLQRPHPPQTRPSHVSAPQAKRITFYKSGDSQFSGVKMAVHKRSFKCFDALLDDLSQKVPLPFGVRTVTTPRGTHTIRQLEQLQDGGCYLCSDRRQVKPIHTDLAPRQGGSHHGKRPHRLESASESPTGHAPYRQRRLLLVKNTEPGVRRSVVLSRRVTRSLSAFLEEVSDVMRFHVRKLYTVEGRKIDNVQSLMTCPNVLVCVGRESFSPLLVNYIQKGSEEKLPGVGPAQSPPCGAHSRTSQQSESQDSKKNMVNFGLETKKSIIHPRSDSSARSARLSISSEKSNGLSTVSQGRAAIMNDDIEKRVVVNKDGSLSVEMRVRFRLQSDETLQWSTQIKKSPSLTNDSCSLNHGQPHYLQHESCSDQDCNSYEPETGDYSSQCGMDTNGCTYCCRQEQPYDLWKNPAHCHKQPCPPSRSTTESHTILRHTQSSSSNSSCNSTRVVRCRARLVNCEDGSEHSQIVQEEMCVTEKHVVEQEVITTSNVDGDAPRPSSSKSVEEEVERPMSAVSASSRVLQELKEDDDDVPPSASRCGGAVSETSENNEKPMRGSSAKQNGRTRENEGSACLCHSTSGVQLNGRASTSKSKTFKSTKELSDGEGEESASVSGSSACSKQSVTSVCPDCGGFKVKGTSGCNSRASNKSSNKSKPATPHSAEDKGDNSSEVSTLSNLSNRTSQRELSMISNGECRAGSAQSKNGKMGDDEVRATSVASSESRKSVCKSECVESRSPSVISVNTSDRVASAMSVKSSTKTSCSHKSSIKVTAPTTEEEDTRSASVQSEKSNASKSRSSSTKSTKAEEARAASVQSLKTNESAVVCRPTSAKSHVSERSQGEKAECESRAEGVASKSSNRSRSASPMSVKSSKSNVSDKSQRNGPTPSEVQSGGQKTRPASVFSVNSVKSEKSNKSEIMEDDTRAASALSVKSSKSHASLSNDNAEVTSNASAKESRAASEISVKSTNSERSQNVEEDTRSESIITVKAKSAKESRPTSVISVKSCKSDKSKKEHVGEEALSIQSEQRAVSNAKEDGEERGESTLSKKSSKSNTSSAGNVQNEEEKQEERAPSAISNTLSVKSSKTNRSLRLASPAKEKDRALSASSAKTHTSTISAKSKKPNQTDISTNVNEESEEKSQRMRSPVSVKSCKSSRFHVVTIKTPEVVSNAQSESKMAEHTQELIPDTVEVRGSSLSVRSGRSTRSKSKCTCEKTNTDKEDTREDSEVAALKREDLDEDSFASVSIVLPEDQESESGESSIYQRTTSKTDISKSTNIAENVQSTPTNAINIPTIETPGQFHNKEGASDEKSRVESSCSSKSKTTHSVKSSKSKKSCCSCGKPTTHANRVASPVASVKTIATTKTGQLTTADDRTMSAMSNASVRNANVTSEKSQESETAMEDKSPATMETKSGESNKSKTNSSQVDSVVKQSVKSPRAPKGQTCSESLISPSLSAADVAKEIKSAEPPERSKSKVSRSGNKSQRSKKEAEPELTPSCLPNASANEVVTDWLSRIPANVSALEDDEEENGVEDIENEMSEGKVKCDGDEEKVEQRETGKEGTKEEEGAVETFEIRAIGMETENSLPKSWHSSAAVMKVLLSSSLGRCRSMPEVSPVYGRRLSTSAKELLDCLTQLQLIESTGNHYSVQKDQRPQFQDVISILQSLWQAEPGDLKDHKDPNGTERVSPPRSSSGVGMSSGSGGSAKENTNQEYESKQNKAVKNKMEDTSETPDGAKATENPSSMDKNVKTPTDTELDTQEGSKSESSPTDAPAHLSKRQSHDPDPMWVLSLLRKLEKQFVNHYVSAMADFKVKWDLEDSLILDKMMAELQDEVSQRIERSVEREVKKIQSRAGKIARFSRPIPDHSTDSTTTDKRKRLLKVIKKHSAKTADSLSDDNGENSDQRSDDEYCPCDACFAKKMAARPVKTNPNAIKAPVQMEFDLVKILLLKSSPVAAKPPPASPKAEVKNEEVKKVVEEEVRNLEVVEEEEEEEEEENTVEESKCCCECSSDQDEEETGDSDRETVREKVSHKETMEAVEESEEASEEQQSGAAVSATEADDADVEDSGTEEKSDLEEENKQHSPLPHQGTRTSVEPQPGSMEDLTQASGTKTMDLPRLASPGGTPQKRKGPNSDGDLDNV